MHWYIIGLANCMTAQSTSPVAITWGLLVRPQHEINIAVTRIEQQAQLELSSEDALLSLRTVGRLCDKLALQVSQPKLRIVKN